MIKAIDSLCTNCGLCVEVCQMDVLRKDKDGKVYIAYPGDCHNCYECVYLCPYDAITIAPGVPKKFDSVYRWERIKEAIKQEK